MSSMLTSCVRAWVLSATMPHNKEGTFGDGDFLALVKVDGIASFLLSLQRLLSLQS